MKLKRFLGVLLALAVFVSGACVSARAAAETRSAALVSAALSQLDAKEGERGYTPYGEWYGYPRGAWCDMFVSWCAQTAELPEWMFPRSASCTSHVQSFRELGCYRASASRGGSYVPQQGDAIFFYNYERYPKGDVLRHVGIVLCVENGCVFTIEGNTKTNRTDYALYEEINPLRDSEQEGRDYVAVKYYPLDDPAIHGYAVPWYDDRAELTHEGFVDLGEYEPLRQAFTMLDARGIMPATSSYTYSPRYGMTRAEFLDCVLRLFDISGWDEGTEPFDDVAEGEKYYEAVMTARSAGIICGTDKNEFLPGQYISGKAAQTILSRVLLSLGLEDRTFEFSEGDLSYLLTPYTVRADLARSLYELLPEAERLRALAEERSAEEGAEEEPEEEDEMEEAMQRFRKRR